MDSTRHLPVLRGTLSRASMIRLTQRSSSSDRIEPSGSEPLNPMLIKVAHEDTRGLQARRGDPRTENIGPPQPSYELPRGVDVSPVWWLSGE
jgi:hypothetical protein